MEGGKQIKRSGTDDRIEFDWNKMKKRSVHETFRVTV